jgi:hypothetical protein
VVRILATLIVLLLPTAASADSATPLEVLQRGAVEAATEEEGAVKPASSMFSNLGMGRVGHASWSLLVPGWSQYRAGNNGRALIFASLEVTIWTVFGVSKSQGNQRENTYQDFARHFAGVGGSDRDDDYWRAVGKFRDSDDYNERVRRDNRAAAEEQAINGEDVTIGINDGTVGGADLWSWTSSTRQIEYRELRADAQTAYDRADAMLFFAVVNRLVAFIEALRSGGDEDPDGQVELYERAGFELSVEVEPNPLRPSGALLLGRSF